MGKHRAPVLRPLLGLASTPGHTGPRGAVAASAQEEGLRLGPSLQPTAPEGQRGCSAWARHTTAFASLGVPVQGLRSPQRTPPL